MSVSPVTNSVVVTYRTQNDHASDVVIHKLTQIAKQQFGLTISFQETTSAPCDLYISLYIYDEQRRQQTLERLKDTVKHFISITHNRASKEQLFSPNGEQTAIPLEKISLLYFDLSQDSICNDAETDSAATEAIQAILA